MHGKQISLCSKEDNNRQQFPVCPSLVFPRQLPRSNRFWLWAVFFLALAHLLFVNNKHKLLSLGTFVLAIYLLPTLWTCNYTTCWPPAPIKGDLVPLHHPPSSTVEVMVQLVVKSLVTLQICTLPYTTHWIYLIPQMKKFALVVTWFFLCK